MGSEWKEIPASEFCDSVRDGTHDSPKQVEAGYLLVTSRHITGNRLDLTSAYMISNADYDEINKRSKVDQWDVLFTMIGTVGQPCLVSEEPNFAIKNIGLFKNKSETHGKFLYYYLCSPEAQHHTRSHSRGTTQQYIPLGELRKFPVRFPDDEKEMHAIAHILGTLDDKIELNRRMNATLEGMAQALFKSWFVDFDPVIDNALAAGNPIPDEFAPHAEVRRQALANGTANRQAAKAFPAAFQETESMGSIPEGWTAGSISDLCLNIQNGGTPKRANEEYWNEGTIPWLTSGEVRQSMILSVKNAITESGLANSSAKWLPERSTVVAMYGATAGQVAFIHDRLTTNQAVCGLVPKEHFHYFNYLLIEGNVKHFENQARGSAQQNISKGIIEESAAIIPSLHAVQSFENQAHPIFEKWTKNILTNDQLSKLRDTLLPKLIAGELRIPEAQNLAAEA